MGQGVPTNPPSMKIYGFFNQKMLQHVSKSFGMNPSTFGDENRDPYLTFYPFLVISEEPHPLSKPALLETRAGNMAVLPMIALLQIRVLFTKQSLSAKWEKVTQLMICDPLGRATCVGSGSSHVLSWLFLEFREAQKSQWFCKVGIAYGWDAASLLGCFRTDHV